MTNTRHRTRTPNPPTGMYGRNSRPGCDFCEHWAPDDMTAWFVRIMHTTVEYWPYGAEGIGLPEQLHTGDRFTICDECEPLLAAGRYREILSRHRDAASLTTLVGSETEAINRADPFRLDHTEAVAGFRRIHLNSNPTPWPQWQASQP